MQKHLEAKGLAIQLRKRINYFSRMRQKIICLVFLSYLFNQSFASDSTFKKYPWQLSLMIGYNSNKVTGSMVDFTNKFNHIDGLSDAKQTNQGGYLFNISFQKNISQYIYLKSGLGFIHRQVYPQNNTNNVYRDSLNTDYLNIPLIIGSSFSLNDKKTIHLFVESGISCDFKISDNSPKAPDRWGFQVMSLLVNFQISGGIDLKVGNSTSIVLQYGYSLGLTNAYKEELYYGAPNEPIFTGYYKYSTNSLSIGMKWEL
jgi:hypothetical protein